MENNRQVRVNIDATSVAIFRIKLVNLQLIIVLLSQVLRSVLRLWGVITLSE